MLSFLRAFPPSSCKPGRRREWAATPKVKDCRDVLATCNKNWAGNIADEDRVGESGESSYGREGEEEEANQSCLLDGWPTFLAAMLSVRSTGIWGVQTYKYGKHPWT